MCNLHWCYTFCTGVTLFALVLNLNCTALSQSESSNFFMNVINSEKRVKCFPSTLRLKNLKTQQSPAMLDLCLGKAQ